MPSWPRRWPKSRKTKKSAPSFSRAPAAPSRPARTWPTARMGEGGAAPDLGDTLDRLYNPLVRRLRALDRPVIAAVNGVAAGAGANLALACDIVLAARSASFIQPFCRLGLVPDAGGTFFLPGSSGPPGRGAWPCSARRSRPSRLSHGA